MKLKLVLLSMAALIGLKLTSLASAGTIGPTAGGGNVAGAPAGCPFDQYSLAYCNEGSTTFSTSAWTINFGFAVTDSFTITGGVEFVSARMINWLFPGDSLSTLDWSIGTTPFSSNEALGSYQAVWLVSDLGINQFGYDIQDDEFNLGSGVLLNAGTYWLTIQNAVVLSGDPVYWDENSGASSAQESADGTIPSESFAIYHGCAACGEVPEPGALGGSGLLLVAGAVLRKMFRSRTARAATFPSPNRANEHI